MSGDMGKAANRSQLRTQAAAWRVRLAEQAETEYSPEFEAWLAEPGAAEAFETVEMAWSAVEELGADHRMMAARSEALTRARQEARRRFNPLRSPWRRVAASMILTILLGAAIALWLPARPTVYETGRGERQVVMLEDGSRLSLDSGTRVSVRLGRDHRSLALKAGQARFDVAHDPSRPFEVTAGGERVTAVGTAFNVERLGSRVVVTLIEGKVRVEREEAGKPVAKPVVMTAGQRLTAAPERPARLEKVAVENVSAWEGGKLVFEDETLPEAVARVNRYAARPISVDPSLATLRVSGSFNAGDTRAFTDAVTAYFPVETVLGAGEQVVLRPRE